jgi:hypothetical protein
MNDEHLEAELERLDAQCQRMASEYCELAKSHSALKTQVVQLTRGGDELLEIIDGFYCPEKGLAHEVWSAAKKGKLL